MLTCTIPNAATGAACVPNAPAKPNPIDAMYKAILSCELGKLEKFIYAYQQDINGLMTLVEVLGRMVNSPELQLTAKKFSWKRGSTLKWGVVCEFRMIRAQRILLIPTEPDFPSIVLEHVPGTVGNKCVDSPALLMLQIGRLVGIPRYCLPPPLASSRH